MIRLICVVIFLTMLPLSGMDDNSRHYQTPRPTTQFPQISPTPSPASSPTSSPSSPISSSPPSPVFLPAVVNTSPSPSPQSGIKYLVHESPSPEPSSSGRDTFRKTLVRLKTLRIPPSSNEIDSKEQHAQAQRGTPHECVEQFTAVVNERNMLSIERAILQAQVLQMRQHHQAAKEHIWELKQACNNYEAQLKGQQALQQQNLGLARAHAQQQVLLRRLAPHLEAMLGTEKEKVRQQQRQRAKSSQVRGSARLSPLIPTVLED